MPSTSISYPFKALVWDIENVPVTCSDHCNYVVSSSISCLFWHHTRSDIVIVDYRYFVVVDSHAYWFKFNHDYRTTLLHAYSSFPPLLHAHFLFLFRVVPSSPSHVASPSLKFKVLIASLCPSQVVAWRIIIPPQPISSFTWHAATLYKTKDNDSTSLLADGDGATGIAKFQECPIVFKSSSSTIRIHVLWLVFFQPGIAGAAAINSWHRLSFPLSLLVVARHSPCQKCEAGGEHGDRHQSRTDSEFVVCHSLMGGRPWTMEHSAKQVGSPCSWLEGIYG